MASSLLVNLAAQAQCHRQGHDDRMPILSSRQGDPNDLVVGEVCAICGAVFLFPGGIPIDRYRKQRWRELGDQYGTSHRIVVDDLPELSGAPPTLDAADPARNEEPGDPPPPIDG